MDTWPAALDPLSLVGGQSWATGQAAAKVEPSHRSVAVCVCPLMAQRLFACLAARSAGRKRNKH